MNFHRFIFTLFFLFCKPVTYAQDGAAIRATVNKNRILIGEPLQLTIEASFSTGSAMAVVHPDTIEHFEFLKKPVFDTLETGQGIQITGTYTITSFDSGHWVIPSFVLSPRSKTNAIPVDVVFSEFDPGKDYHDIKDIIEVELPRKKPRWWIIAVSTLLLAGLAVYFLRKKKPVTVPAPVQQADPYEEAIKDLELLQREKPEAKKYHSQLTDIFRLYIFRKKGILSLQKTTADIVLQLRDLPVSRDRLDKLSQALRLSDFVKFAQYVPSQEDDQKVYDEIINSITAIEKTEPGPPRMGGS